MSFAAPLTPIVGAPSLMRTIAAGAFLPSAPFGRAAMELSAWLIAAAVAVPPDTVSESNAPSTCE